MSKITTEAEATSRGDVRGALPAGTRLKIYDLVSVLGQGGFGITYLARDTLLNRDVAIKEYLPTSMALRDDGTMVMPRSTALAAEFLWGRERFLEEARTLAKLGDAPAIVRVHDYLEANGTAYMVMALVRGETLQTRRETSGGLAPAAVERMLYQLLDGLEEVHAAGFLHRDIKPANIVIDAKGNPTLIDFGASRAAIADRTSAMTAIFTPGYAPVEQFTSARQGPWTDIYGLAATLYYVITGTAPPTAIDRVLDDSFRPLCSILPAGFPKRLLAGLDAGLEVRAERRPQDIAHWREILGRPDDSLSSPATQVMQRAAGADDRATTYIVKSAGQTARARPARRLIWPAAVALGLLAVAGAGYSVLHLNAPPSMPSAVQEATVAAPAQKSADEPKAEIHDAAQNEQVVPPPPKAVEAPPQQSAGATRQESEAEAVAKVPSQLVPQSAPQLAPQPVPQSVPQPVPQADTEVQAAEAARLAKKQAEAAETALHLSANDRKRLQVALSSLGNDTRGYDGVFGARSREMIAAWQGKNSLPETGFLTAPQQQTLLSQATLAVSRYDDDMIKAAEAARKADDEARRVAAAKDTAPAPQPAQTPVPGALASEPLPGQLMPGKRVLVDDGTCGRGEIKEVTGGSNIGKNNTGGAKRIIRCISRDAR